MPDKRPHCIRCNAIAPSTVRLPLHLRYLCDSCSEDVGRRAHLPAIHQHPPPQPDERKSKRKSTRKRTAVATALVFMLLPLIGCSIAWTGSVSLHLDPAPLLKLQQLPAPPVAVTELKTTGSYSRDLASRMES